MRPVSKSELGSRDLVPLAPQEQQPIQSPAGTGTAPSAVQTEGDRGAATAKVSPGATTMLWWGYQHENGGFQTKPYHPHFGQGDMEDAIESPFVRRVFGPFHAAGRDDALAIIERQAA